MPKRIKLEGFPCPVCADGKKLSWVCGSWDGNAMYLDDTGNMECEFSNHTGILRDWRWRCSGPKHNGEYLPADREGWTFALAHAVLLSRKGGANWAIRLIKQIKKQYPEEADSDSDSD